MFSIATLSAYATSSNLPLFEYLFPEDVPAGKPYKIINVSDIPSDRTFRDAWEYVE